jgi:hypothetical protein
MRQVQHPALVRADISKIEEELSPVFPAKHHQYTLASHKSMILATLNKKKGDFK